MATISSFRDLRVFKAAFELAMEIHRISKTWPADEKYELTSQIRRSSRSVCACLGEAWRKRRYPAAFIAKLNDAEAEAAETRVWLDFALACGYLAPREYRSLDRRYFSVLAQLVRMVDQADQWAVGPPGRSSANRGRRQRSGSPDAEVARGRSREPDPQSPSQRTAAKEGSRPTPSPAANEIPQSRPPPPKGP